MPRGRSFRLETVLGIGGVTVLLLLSDSLSDLVVVTLLISPFAVLGGIYIVGLAIERVNLF